jgi:hypothetical protein
VDLDAVAAGIQALNVDLLAVREVDRTLAGSGRADQPAVIAQALGVGCFWSYAPALAGDDFQPLADPDPGGPAYGNLLVSRLPLAEVEQLRFPWPAAASTGPRCWPASGSARAGHDGGHPPVQQAGPQPAPAAGAAAAGWVPNGAAAAGGRPEPALHGVGGLTTGWPETGRGRTWHDGATHLS